ncbi:hypothetical protein [Flavivirga algicola]|uniref:Uncharacterized protein n=1 Tax=Flavivirga algicola TaxID=2729136 RepID=A0ABX1RVK5_9FLAO|nr:hypothetical protein [Flavivirga algicola]NMH87201.1 hypothetical protein [Flavivirga algicola]
MKALKITLFVAFIFATLVSCTKQDLNEDDVLRAGDDTEMPTPYTGGDLDN